MYHVVSKLLKNPISPQFPEEFLILGDDLFRDWFDGDPDASYENNEAVYCIVDSVPKLDHAYDLCDDMYKIAEGMY